MTNSNARDKFLALIRQNGWVNDPTAKISQGRYREEEWVQDPYTFVRLAADGVGKWRIRLSYPDRGGELRGRNARCIIAQYHPSPAGDGFFLPRSIPLVIVMLAPASSDNQASTIRH